MRTTAVVIGAGQSGLAASWWLSQRSIDHVVLERGEVANTWRRERWDSLRLLTPNWQSRLPGYGYQGNDPDGFRTMPETIAFIEGYAKAIAAPVQTRTTVVAVRRSGDGYEVETDRGLWQADTVIIATGAFNLPQIPAVARSVPAGIATLAASAYRNPDQLDPGGVMVVGASATGAQLADEIRRSGRAVTLAVGEHVRVPRVYRGRDIQWWMDATGLLDEPYDTIDDIVRARNVASLQLAGYPDRRDIDLNALTAIGVKLVGRLAGINAEGKAQFSGSLRNVCALADLKMHRLLDAIDTWATERGLDAELAPPRRYEPTQVEAAPPLLLDLTRGSIKTIVWATGFRPDYSWLQIPVLDAKGNIRHDGGVVTESPGLYVMGLPFLRRRKSSLIDGAGDDARDITAHLTEYLRAKAPAARTVERSAAGA
ncbi:MAG: NAD(P)-binding domain-containing protein [Burkholderiales bacterium]|nr:NAD(P)-binding domain-containing protein [Burkholderiales bacterium]